MFWHYPNVWGPSGLGVGPFSAVRSGDSKLISYHAEPRYELVNLARDLGEQQNLAQTEPAKARELAATLAAWLRETNAQMPVDTQTGKPVALPALRFREHE